MPRRGFRKLQVTSISIALGVPFPYLWIVVAAYEVLSDSEKRRIYDQQGEEGLKRHEQGGGQAHNPFDIFAQMFGHRSAGSEEQRGPDINMEVMLQRCSNGMFYVTRGLNLTSASKTSDVNSWALQMEVSLKDLYLGKQTDILLKKQIICRQCGGCFYPSGPSACDKG